MSPDPELEGPGTRQRPQTTLHAMQCQEVLSLGRMHSSGYVSDLKGILAKETSDAGPKDFLLVQERIKSRTGNVDTPRRHAYSTPSSIAAF